MSVVVVAPDKFKGSLSAGQVAAHLARGLRDRAEHVRQVPMADGGEGTVDAAVAAGWRRHVHTVRGPLAESVSAAYAVSLDGSEAVVELAAASGLDLTRPTVHSARVATSYGTGTLIRCALEHGVDRVVLAVGGSACNDGGAGMMVALGARILDEQGNDVAWGGAALRSAVRLDLSDLDPRLAHTSVVLAADVDNPLLGPRGAVSVYGEQKGADAATRAELENGLGRWADLVEAAVPDRPACRDAGGAGAAGGVGFAALALLGAHRRSGIETVIEMTGLGQQLSGADLVITGEGSLDAQSLYGKTPVGVAAAAAAAGLPTVAVAGRNTLTPAELSAHGILRCFALADLEPDPAASIRNAGALLEQVALAIAEEYLRGEHDE